ncbi:dystrophin [Elysia marginata]|uniref:Dystrophin n=1 Tax=Elysia marginata TaxID=1093978 RepID=A0AAV4ERV8_9GAST|nr:dystrophin [Elysia marginata]
MSMSSSESRHSAMSTVSVELLSYQDSLENVLTWLLEAEEVLDKQLPVAQDVTKVKEQFNQHEEFMVELTRHQDSIGGCLKEGNDLLTDGKVTAEEEKEIRTQMSLLNNRWEELRVKALDRQSRWDDDDVIGNDDDGGDDSDDDDDDEDDDETIFIAESIIAKLPLKKTKMPNKISCKEIRNKTQVSDIAQYIAKQKWKWAGHVARLQDNRWTLRVTEWQPRNGKRSRGRQARRWRGDIVRTMGNTWTREAKDKEEWRHGAEGLILQWMDGA